MSTTSSSTNSPSQNSKTTLEDDNGVEKKQVRMLTIFFSAWSSVTQKINRLLETPFIIFMKRLNEEPMEHLGIRAISILGATTGTKRY